MKVFVPSNLGGGVGRDVCMSTYAHVCVYVPEEVLPLERSSSTNIL